MSSVESSAKDFYQKYLSSTYSNYDDDDSIILSGIRNALNGIKKISNNIKSQVQKKLEEQRKKKEEEERQRKLEEERRRQELEKQRKLEEERKRAINSRNQVINKLNNAKTYLESIVNEQLSSNVRDGINIKALENKYLTLINELKNIPLPNNTELIHQQTKSIEDNFYRRLEAFKNELLIEKAKVEKQNKAIRNFEKVDGITFNKLLVKKAVDVELTDSEPIEEVNLDEAYNIIQTCEADVAQMDIPLEVLINGKSKLLNIINEMKEMLSNDSLSPQERLNAVKKQQGLYQYQIDAINRELVDYHQLCTTYISLCELFNEIPQPIEDFYYKEQLNNEVERLHNQLLDMKKKEYIQANIDEVMAGFGYKIIRSDYLKPIEKGTRNRYKKKPIMSLA